MIADEGVVPPYATEIKHADVIKFHHIDGMYSFCTDKEGNICHLCAWEEVEIVEISGRDE